MTASSRPGLFIAALLMTSFANVSCGPQSRDSQSTIKHMMDDWKDLKLTDLHCKNTSDVDTITTITNMVYFNRDGDQDYLKYSEDHLKILLNASQNRLPSWLKFEHFCVGAPNRIWKQINGMSAPSGNLSVFQGTLLSGEESIFAAIMAHELGHILGQHVTAKDFAGEDHTLLASKEFEANWSEQLADEIGLELYLRAGWPLDGFVSMFKAMAAEDSIKLGQNKNSKMASANGDSQSKCLRGEESHPNLCWRIENASKEYEKHRSIYSAFQSSQSNGKVLGSRFAELRVRFEQYWAKEAGQPSSND